MTSRRRWKALPTSSLDHPNPRSRSTTHDQPKILTPRDENKHNPDFQFWRPSVIQGLSPVSSPEDLPFQRLCVSDDRPALPPPSKTPLLPSQTLPAVRAHAPARLRHQSFVARKTLEAGSGPEPDSEQKRVQALVRYSALQRFLQEGMTHWRGRKIQDLLEELENEFCS